MKPPMTGIAAGVDQRQHLRVEGVLDGARRSGVALP